VRAATDGNATQHAAQIGPSSICLRHVASDAVRFSDRRRAHILLTYSASQRVLGAGKTTLLNTLTGTIARTSGHVTLNGEPMDWRWRRKMAYVMQQEAFYANLTLRETLTVCNIFIFILP